MKNTGYISAGHLVGNKKNRVDYIITLRHLVRMLTITLDDTYIDKKSALWRFEEFFKSADICLHSFSNFVNGILKNPVISGLKMQIEVEKAVWSTIRRRADSNPSDFQLFSIFNRFADPLKLPLAIRH